MDEHGPDAPGITDMMRGVPSDVKSATTQHWPRKYLPTLAELIDRLCIVQLKSIFISENREAYRAEQKLIEHDIDLVLREKDSAGHKFGAVAITAATMLMLTNRFIWENENKARTGGSEQDRLLKLTHSVNGSRNQAKNVLAVLFADRTDLKIDCFAAEFKKDFGVWDVFDAEQIQQGVLEPKVPLG